MRYSKGISKWMLAAGMALAGASALPAADWRDGYRGGGDVRSDYRDLRRDYSQADRLRDQIAMDRARLDDDYRRGNRWAARRDSEALARDQRALDFLRRDTRWDTGRDRDWDRR